MDIMQWINVNERLPPEFDWVLVCNTPKESSEPRCVNIWRWTDSGWDYLNGIDDACPTFSDVTHHMLPEEVTHWMPLPTQPID